MTTSPGDLQGTGLSQRGAIGGAGRHGPSRVGGVRPGPDDNRGSAGGGVRCAAENRPGQAEARKRPVDHAGTALARS